MPPKFLKKYFWDVDFEKLDVKKCRQFILKRILEYGDEKAVNWMAGNFSNNEIAGLLSFARIDPKSANFWTVVLGLNRRKILCLSKSYLKIRKRHWPY